MILPRAFYDRDPVTVARQLIGKRLVRDFDSARLAGLICEVEAYLADIDSANHAFRGRTPRNAVMFGPPGFAYVYFVYGQHFMFNVVTEEAGKASAVLVRGIHPIEGVDHMAQFRRGNHRNLADGPGKLCQALRIDKNLHGWDLTRGEQIWLEEGAKVPDEVIVASPRVGIHFALEKDQAAPLRFLLRTEDMELILAR